MSAPARIANGVCLDVNPAGCARQVAEQVAAERLLPPAAARCALDGDYIFACCGALFAHFAAAAVVALMRRSAGV